MRADIIWWLEKTILRRWSEQEWKSTKQRQDLFYKSSRRWECWLTAKPRRELRITLRSRSLWRTKSHLLFDSLCDLKLKNWSSYSNTISRIIMSFCLVWENIRGENSFKLTYQSPRGYDNLWLIISWWSSGFVSPRIFNVLDRIFKWRNVWSLSYQSWNRKEQDRPG